MLEVADSSSRTSSASRPSASAVKPTRSANRTVTSRRSATGRRRARVRGSRPRSRPRPAGRGCASSPDRAGCRSPRRTAPRAVRGATGRAGAASAVAAFAAELAAGLVARPAGGTVHARNVACAESSVARRSPGRSVLVAQLRDPGAPRRELGPRSGARSASSAKATSSACRSIAHSSGSGQPDGLDGVDVLLGQRDVRDRRVVRVERDRHAHPMEPGERVGRDATARSRPASSRSGTGPGSRRASTSSAHSAGSSMAPGPWAIRSGSTASARRTCAAPPHSPAWSVIRRPPVAGGLERRGVEQRIRVGRLGSGEVPAGQALVAEPGRGLGEVDVGARGRASAAPCR